MKRAGTGGDGNDHWVTVDGKAPEARESIGNEAKARSL